MILCVFDPCANLYLIDLFKLENLIWINLVTKKWAFNYPEKLPCTTFNLTL